MSNKQIFCAYPHNDLLPVGQLLLVFIGDGNFQFFRR